MSENKQAKCRKWQITINNPTEKGYTHTSIKEKLEKFSSLKYWCMADEVGEAKLKSNGYRSGRAWSLKFLKI